MKYTRYLGTQRPSRRSYPPHLEARLAPMRAAITVLDIEDTHPGAGDSKLLDGFERDNPGCRCLVLDLWRAATIDKDGAAALQRLGQRLQARGVKLMIAGLADGSEQGRALRDFAAGLPIAPDADRAIEAAERHLLGGLLADAVAEVRLPDSTLLRGLSPEQCEVVSARMQAHSLAADEVLFSAGDTADGMYVLTRGSISILSPVQNGRSKRFITMAPGSMLGETAMLDGGGRTASAVADSAAVVHRLSHEALYALERDHPAVAIRLYHNIAHHLSRRLRDISAIWQSGRG